ncbi:MAG: type II CAAX endopeptidase family protein [Ktedonobacterales bacterium]
MTVPSSTSSESSSESSGDEASAPSSAPSSALASAARAGEQQQRNLYRRYGPAGPVPWALRQTLIGLAVTLIPWLTLTIGALAASPQTAQPTKRLPLASDLAAGITIFILSAVIEGAFLLAPAYYALLRVAPGSAWRERLASLGLRRTALLPAAGLTLAGAVVALVGSAAYSAIIQAIHAPLQTNADQLAQQAQYAPFTTLGALATAVFVAPFCEEVFFRGFSFAGLLRGVPVWPALMLSALIFAVAHADLGSFIPLAFIGLILGYARWRTGSIWPGMLIHALNNGVAALFLLPFIFH